MAKFVINNNDFLLTRLFLFFASRDLHSYMSFDVVNFSDNTTCKQINKKKTIDIFEAIQSI